MLIETAAKIKLSSLFPALSCSCLFAGSVDKNHDCVLCDGEKQSECWAKLNGAAKPLHL